MTIVIFLLLLSVLILFHELGHFAAARLFGIKAEEFGFGFPPRLVGIVKDRGKWKWVWNGDQKNYEQTIWSINWLPLGGFVRIKGEAEDGLVGSDSIHAKPVWQRLVVIAAGVIMNWILAFVLFSGLFFFGSRMILDQIPSTAQVQNPETVISYVMPGSPANLAQIQPGDVLRQISGSDIGSVEDAKRLIAAQGSSTIVMTVSRKDESRTFSVTSTYLTDIQRAGIGIGMMDVGFVSFSLGESLSQGAFLTGRTTVGVVEGFWRVLRDLFVERKVAPDVAGPVGIASIAGEIANQGLAPLIQFAALLSVNLAVMNILPIPALDGGRVIFLFIEGIRRRPVARRLEIAIHNIAFLLLLGLMLLVTIRDVGNLLK